MTDTITNGRVPSEADFRPDWSPAEKLRFCLRHAVLAPSSHNSQPWLFRVLNDTVEVYADRNRSLRVVDPDDRALVISCGAALHHLRIAIRYFGHADRVTPFPDPNYPDLLATVRLGEPREREDYTGTLFRGIPDRRTTRTAFSPDPIPSAVLTELLHAGDAYGVWVHRFESAGDKHRAAELVAAGDREQFANEAFRRELAHWLRPNNTAVGDGIPGYSQGVGLVASLVGPWVVRTFDVGGGTAAKDGQLAEGSPLLAALGTDTDDRPAWLDAGQAVSHLLLLAQSHGLTASYLNQPIEVPDLRPRLASLIGTAGHPQLLLRVGFPTATPPPTPRRALTEVLQTLHLPGVT